MRRPAGIAGAIALARSLAGCAPLSGLSDYAFGSVPLDAEGASDAASPSAARGDAGDGASGAPIATDAGGADAGPGADESGCEPAPACSSAAAYACPAGACNTPDGACTAAGQGCSCASDADCKSGKCVKTAGQNDVSCVTGCSGVGVADGFGCELAADGIPAACTLAFGYPPSNFDPTSVLPAAAATFDCGTTTFDSDGAGTWDNACGQPVPTPVRVAQSGGPDAMVLGFGGLTVAAGATLRLVGPLPVILAIYGNAAIDGNVSADGSAGATNSATPGAAGAGGNYACGTSAGDAPPNAGHNNGGGGGGASGSGGAGGADGSGNAGGDGGAPRANALLVPLYGGCPGGSSGNCGQVQGGGGAGGAVQISVAGTFSVSGTISARGGAGASGVVGAGCGLSGVSAGGGGGSGGAVLLEGPGAPSTGIVVGGSGGNGGGAASSGPAAGGAGGTASAPAGVAGGSNGNGAAAGGGGGGYGYLRTNPGAPPLGSCTTMLKPAPVCDQAYVACLCVADTDCSSGRCVNASGQCTGPCSGTGAPDRSGCQAIVSAATGACGPLGSAACAP